MKKPIKLLLWVSNMHLIGAQDDYTTLYLGASGAEDIPEKHGVTLTGQTLSGSDPERLWQAFREMAQAVAAAGHGGETEHLPAPTLTAKLPDAKDSAASLQELVSQTATTFEQWAKESLIEEQNDV